MVGNSQYDDRAVATVAYTTGSLTPPYPPSGCLIREITIALGDMYENENVFLIMEFWADQH